MRLLSALLLFPILSAVLAQERPQGEKLAERFDYQSDVARLRKIVIESLYSHRDVWLRELISNANDAIEKYRVTSLKGGVVDNSPLNITMTLVPGSNGQPGRFIISDTGIGMTAEELTKNLGTLAKSGTSDFVKKAEESKGKSGEADPNLIGQFGLGFYSSFLVASDVYVASLPPATKEDPNPIQHVFASGSEASSFDVYPDPRGNTLGRGTEITLILKDDAKEYLQEKKVRDLVAKHSAFSTAYPIYLWATKTEEVPLIPEDPGYISEETKEDVVDTTQDEADEIVKEKPEDEDEVIVEDAEEKKPEIKIDATPQTKNVTFNAWDHLNDQPPLWMRDPKTVTDNEYNEFYRATFKDPNNPIAWHHFKGDTGAGTGFRAVIFLPPEIPQDFWSSPHALTDQVRLFVKRVFITNDLGEDALPKWISWLRAIVDADDLPLNVSRETLQSTKFMAQTKQVIIKRFIQVLNRIAADDPRKYAKLMKAGYGAVLKLGAIESKKDQKKIVSAIKFTSNLRDSISLNEYIEKRKKGQDQIFFMAGVGETPESLNSSIFVEKLTARGYEVLLLNEPMDEILFAQLKTWKDYIIQDVSKEGLKFGDEEEAEAEKLELEESKAKFEPLLSFLKNSTTGIVADVVVSSRLVTSPCAIVANTYGYSGNMQKILQGQHQKDSSSQAIVAEWARKQRVLEINPKSPLMAGMLKKILELNDVEEGEEKDADLDEQMKEMASILLDGALVRSGYEVTDTNVFFNRVDRVLRRSLGVSETAKADATVKPAPPTVEIDEKAVEAEKKAALPDLDEPENLANYIVTDDLPFDPSKAVDINVDDHTEGKVGLVQDIETGNKWDEEGADNLQKILDLGEKLEKEKKHDEL